MLWLRGGVEWRWRTWLDRRFRGGAVAGGPLRPGIRARRAVARIIPRPGVTATLVVPCDFHRGRLDTETIHKIWLRLERVEPLRGSRRVNRSSRAAIADSRSWS